MSGAAGRPLQAVLFDLDGTLYRNGPMRYRMMAELLWATARGLFGAKARHRLQMIKAYRHALEELRGQTEAAPEGWRAAQLAAAAARTGRSPEEVRSVVREWMEQRPLKHLRHCTRPGLRATLERLRDANLGLGVYSDYPVADKLAALGIADLMTVQLHAGMAGVPRPKPNPDGFLRGCELLEVPPERCAYVGDRPEVDAVGARRAGLGRVVILGKAAPSAAAHPAAVEWLKHFAALPECLLGDPSGWPGARGSGTG